MFPELSFDIDYNILLQSVLPIPNNENETRNQTLSNLDSTRVECQVCFKSLTKKSLRAHLKLHELKKSEKKFSCEKCPKKFYTRNVLTQHEKVHTKPKICRICGEGFARESSRSRHLKNHR
jgi:uncharacterized Zn-finger protein